MTDQLCTYPDCGRPAATELEKLTRSTIEALELAI